MKNSINKIKYSPLFTRLLCLFTFLFIPSSNLFAENSVVANLNPTSGTIEDIFYLELDLKLDQQNSSISELRFEQNSQFAIQYIGKSSNHFLDMNTGRLERSLKLKLELKPSSELKPGVYKIPDGSIKIDSKEYTFKSPNIEIVTSSAQISGANIDFIQLFDTEEVFLGQQVLYQAEAVVSAEIADQPQFPRISPEGFIMELEEEWSENVRSVGGTTVRRFSSSRPMFPTKTGEIVVPKRKLSVEVIKDTFRQRRGFGSFFGSFDPLMGRLGLKTKEESAWTKETKLKVKPLPEPPLDSEGNPFTGTISVGEIKLSAFIDTLEVNNGQSATMTLKLEGDANLRAIKIDPKEDENFKFYVDQPKLEVEKRQNKAWMTKTFKIALVPKRNGDLKLPKFKFLRFDPIKEEYKFLETPDKNLKVEGIQTQPTTSNDLKKKSVEEIKIDKESNNLPNQDKTFKSDIKEQKLYKSENNILPILASKSYIVITFIISILAFVISSLKNKAKTLNPLSEISELQKNLKSLSKSVSKDDKLKTYNLIKSSLSKIFLDSDKENSSYTLLELLSNTNLKINDKSKDLISREFEKLEEEVFSNKENSQLEPLKLIEVISDIVKQNTKTRFNLTKFFPFILSIIILEPQFLKAEEPGNLVKKANNLFLEEKYVEAEELYLKALKLEHNNGSILYNLGNTEFRLKNIGKAIYYYKKALDISPRDSQIKQNLWTARLKVPGHIVNSFVPPIFISKNEIMIIFLIISLTLIVSSLSYLKYRNKYIYAFRKISLFYTIIAFIFCISIGQDEKGNLSFNFNNTINIVIIKNNTNVYAGNSESYQVISILGDGEELEAIEIRDSWYKVLLSDSKTGWIKKEQLMVM